MDGTVAQNPGSAFSGAIKVDEAEVGRHLSEMVRETVEQTLNKLLDAEADAVCRATRYERSAERVDTRSGYYERGLQTKAGEVTLKVPRLRRLPLETQIIERYRRRESSVEEAMIEMYLAGVSLRRVEDITEMLWGSRVSPSTISELNQKVYAQIETWLNRPLEGRYPYVYLDGIWLKRCWSGETRNVAILVAVGVSEDGYREVLGAREGCKEDKSSWLEMLRWLKTRGLQGVRLVISDKCLGLVEALAETFPDADWQRCMVHFYRNVFAETPRHRGREVAAMLKAIHAQEDREAATRKSSEVAKKLESLKLAKAAAIVRQGVPETLAYMAYPMEHWTRIRTNNMLERIMREIRRRTRVVGSFPDGNSAVMLAAARLRHVAGTKWGTKRYLNMNRLDAQTEETEVDAA